MGLEIAIYNGFCDDGNKVVNSMKAAYLYADEVRVYDLINQGFSDEGVEERIDARESLRKKWYEESYRVIERYPFWTDNNLGEDEVRSTIEKIPNSDRVLLVEASKGIQEYEGLEILRQYVKNMEAIQTLRDSNNQLYSRYYSQEELQRLGIRLIEPDFDNEDDLPDLVKPFLELRNAFLEDKGYKLLNAVPMFENEELRSHAFAISANLAEYAFTTLPGFEDATLDEIVDIRKELNKYIVPYRAAVLNMSQKIKGIPNTESFEEECKLIYFHEIEPQVAAIHAAIHDNNVVGNTLN